MKPITGPDGGRPLRILAALRISLDDDSSSSIERQREKLKEWLHVNPRCTLVHATEDRSVSGAVDLKDRPELGPWLAEDKRDQWDAVWVSTQDRLGRDDLHFMAFVKDLLDWQKGIYVHDDPSFDVSTETGRLIAYAKATQAAGELTRIRKRALDSRDYLRRNGLWAGGNLPFGYEPAPVAVGDKTHYTLVQQRDYAKLLREVVQRVEDGESLAQIARDFNEREILTWQDYLRTLPGREGRKPKGPKGVQWHPSTISRVFKKVSCIGWVQYQDREMGKVRIAELDNGEPVMFTDEPILAASERTAVLAKIEERAAKPQRARRSVARLSGIAKCGNCGQRMTINRVTHKLKSGAVTYERYRCASTTRASQCSMPAYIEKDIIDEFLDDLLLWKLGDKEEVRVIKNAGEDHTVELEQYRTRLARVEKEDEQGWYDDDRESYLKKRRNLVARIKELESKPVIPATVIYEPTGRTFRQKWEGMTDEEQREYLLAHNVLIGVWRSGIVPKQRAAFVWLGDLVEAAHAMGLEYDPDEDALWAFTRMNATEEQEAVAKKWIEESLPEGKELPSF
ncbi:recombinase family protein [Streptomyces sp. NPDC051173]|uniref:recombinase family protein n=1 Tax=Streptomyces sp. NPDC051173 TaxID=3155164 RepID=UPI00344B2E52